MGSILGLGRSPGGGNGNMLQYSCQEYPIHRGASWAAVSKGSKIVGYDRETEHTCLLQKQTNKQTQEHQITTRKTHR